MLENFNQMQQNETKCNNLTETHLWLLENDADLLNNIF